MKSVLRNAVTGAFPNFGINYGKVPVSRGNLLNTCNGPATVTCKGIHFTWDYCKSTIGAGPTDRAIMVAYCEALNQCIFTSEGPERHTGKGILAVNNFRKQKVHTWLAFISADKKQVSDSVYTGEVFIT
jgi:hypothetical protein